MAPKVEKKKPQALRRRTERKFASYDNAHAARKRFWATSPEPAKIKIFARQDGTFDLVVYERNVA